MTFDHFAYKGEFLCKKSPRISGSIKKREKRPSSTLACSRTQKSQTSQRFTTRLPAIATSFRSSLRGSPSWPLIAYPFSERYGWVEDRYGLSWQLIYAGGSEIQQTITPVLMFVGRVCGKTEEAINFYASVFKDSPAGAKAAAGTKAEILARYGKGEEPDREGTVRYAHFTLLGQEFGAMDSAREHKFAFNEAISFVVPCDTQEEIDYYWGKLSADPKAEQCGWLKDAYGLSWQIAPTVMNEMLQDKDKKKIARVTEAFLKMKQFDIAKLKEAYEGATKSAA
jgi:predicted 3-demethylubiquinone-9 3-methyltransferase (glyoxalase superfamily)